MTFNAEALAGKSKQAQIVKAFQVKELEVSGGLTWIPTLEKIICV